MRRRERLLDSSDSDHVDLFESPVQLFETKAPGAAKQKKLDDVNVAIAFNSSPRFTGLYVSDSSANPPNVREQVHQAADIIFTPIKVEECKP